MRNENQVNQPITVNRKSNDFFLNLDVPIYLSKSKFECLVSDSF